MKSARIHDISLFQCWSKSLPRQCLVDRDRFLLSLAAGHSVLHLGAADSPFHKDKAARGELLHQKLEPVASRLLGIDSDLEAVSWLRERHNIANIHVADICAGSLSLGTFDLIFCCDIIEHVSEPSPMLEAIKNLMHPDSRLIVTTVNALSIKVALRAVLGREAVHPDHVSYYSFATLSSLLLRHGFLPVEYATFAYPTVTKLAGAVFATLYMIAPSSADGILLAAKI